jgi:hypothetical protein
MYLDMVVKDGGGEVRPAEKTSGDGEEARRESMLVSWFIWEKGRYL